MSRALVLSSDFANNFCTIVELDQQIEAGRLYSYSDDYIDSYAMLFDESRSIDDQISTMKVLIKDRVQSDWYDSSTFTMNDSHAKDIEQCQFD